MKQRLPLAPSDGKGDGADVPWAGGTLGTTPKDFKSS